MIETQEYKNFSGFSGDDHKVGVSKPLSELTPDDIINYDKYLCGAINKYVNVIYFGQIPQISLPEDADNKPMFSTNNSWDNTFWCSQPPKKDLYMRTLLLNVPNNKRDREYTFTVLDNNVRIVTELTDFQDMYITTKIGKNGGGNPYAAKTEAGVVETGKISGIVKSMLTDTSYIIPVWVITDGTNLWITSGVIYHKYYVNSGNNLTSQGFFTGIADFNNNKSNSLSFGINPNATAEPVKCTDLIPDDGTPYTVDMNGKKFGIMVSYTASNYQPRGTFWFNNNIESNTTPFGENNQFIDITAYYGMYMRSIVKNNGEYVWYKPIITDGMVTGYSTDMNAKSDIDNWEILENHNIPIIPPSPGGDDDDDIDDITLTMSTVSNAAFRKLFALNATELNQLEAALSGNYLEPLPSGFDPLQSVISLSVFPWDITNINWISCNTTPNAEITISGWNTGVTGNYVTGATSAFIELGSFNVEHRHNNFLDYAPYTTVSVYVPYCGEIELPTNLVMGQSVRVFLIYDIPSGSCRAVIKSSNGSILGTIAGNFSSEIEITSSEAGLKKQAIISTALNTTGQVISTAIGVVKEDISAATGGIVGSLGAVSQSIASMNKNYTSSVGATDGIVNFFMPDQCYIKITRPRVSIPSNYGHTTGYACNKTMNLGDLIPGNYYVANNPDLSDSLGNEEEKAILKAALENGFFK